ncbi:MAG TPA: efflux RND transporter periplasmic adaptor subunit [Lacipirellulaceae bacterium]|nr:efflux RND transporter periplasmic adaptor subunit [Lacipirellulaceae bacterium]
MSNRILIWLCVCVAAAVAAPRITSAAGEKDSTAPAASESLKTGIQVQSVVLRLLEEAEVPAQEAGVITGVAVVEGQNVKQGQSLAQIDDQVARLAVDAAKAKYDIARAKATNDVRIRFAQKETDVSEAELRRSTESIEHFPNSVSQSQLDVEQLTVQKNRLEAEQARHEQEIATLEMKQQQAELNAAQAQIMRRRIVAPFDGVIVQIYARKGEWAEPGQKALRIVNVDRLKAEGFIRAEDATKDLVGRNVKLVVEPGGAQHTFGGKIVFVSPEVDPITSQVRIWADIDNHDGPLRPGQPAHMVISQ